VDVAETSGQGDRCARLVTKWSQNPSDKAVFANPSGCVRLLHTGPDQHSWKRRDISVRAFADGASDVTATLSAWPIRSTCRAKP
jgi:hypothetical protein